jgi:hypothetical protein
MIKVVILLEQLLFRKSRLCRVWNLRKRSQTMYSMLYRQWNYSFSIPGYVVSENAWNQFHTMYSRLCRIWKRSKLIPDYVFHAMSIVKSLHFQFQTMSCWKSLSLDSRLCIPYSMLCRWWNLFIFNSRLCRVENLWAPIPDYVFHAMSMVKSLLF